MSIFSKKWTKSLLIASLAVTAQLNLSAHAAEPTLDSTAKPDWYLHMDINAIKASQLSNSLDAERKQGIKFLNALLGESLTNQANYLTLQSELDGKQRQVVIEGDFADGQLLNSRLKQLGFEQTINFKDNIILTGNLSQLITELKRIQKQQQEGLTEEEKKLNPFIVARGDNKDAADKELFFSLKENKALVISDDLNQVKAWLNANKTWQPKKHSNVFEVVVDIEKSLMHGGVNIDQASDVFEFESISAQQLSQISATYNEYNGIAEIQLGLETSDDQTAAKVKSVAHGLIALKMLSNSNAVVANLLASAQIEQDANNVIFKLSGTIESFRTLIEQH
jgi:hypothetical protein